MVVSLNIPIVDRAQVKEALSRPKDQAAKPEIKRLERRYEEMVGERQPYLDEARRISKAIMPYLYPEPGQEDPFAQASTNQSLVAKGVINLGKELSSTIFPANARFFENTILPSIAKMVEEAKAQAGEEEGSEVASTFSQVNNGLVARDQHLRKIIKSTPDSENFYQAMIHGIVAGQFCFAKPNLHTSKVYTLDNFVSEFDSTGELVECIVKDTIHISKFSPEDLQELFGTSDLERFEEAKMTSVVVYTRQVRRFDHWEIQVEIAGRRFKKMEGKEDLECPPFTVIPFFLFPGKSYGVSWCSHNKGDIIHFENLSLAVTELSKAAAKVVGIIPPDMQVTQSELSGNAGLSWIYGSPSPIQMIYADVSRNLDALTTIYEMSRQVILQAFMLTEAVRRNAERVTSEEIRTIMQGLRALLGGLYLSVARRWQYPYIKRMDKLAVQEGLIPPLPEGTYQLNLTAGLETLEAAEELQALDQLTARLAQFGEQAMARVNINEYDTRVANYLGVVADGLLMDDEELQESMGIRQIVNMAQQLGPQGPQMMAMMLQTMMEQTPGATSQENQESIP